MLILSQTPAAEYSSYLAEEGSISDGLLDGQLVQYYAPPIEELEIAQGGMQKFCKGWGGGAKFGLF